MILIFPLVLALGLQSGAANGSAASAGGPPDGAAVASQTGASAPVRKVGGGVLPPHVINQAPLDYPKLARKKKISGITLVGLIVDAQGNPINVHVVRSMADSLDAKYREAALSLDKAAVDAVSKYRFAPATENGKPVPVVLNVEVNFKIF